MAYVQVGARCLLALVFVASAYGKLRTRRAYRGFVAATAVLLPPALSRPQSARGVAVAVLVIEVAMPVCLAVPRTAPAALVAAGAVLAGFALALAFAVRRGERAACHCFGRSDSPPGRADVARNALLVVVALLGLLAGRRATEPAGTLLAAICGAVLAVLLIHAGDLASLVRDPIGKDSQ